MIATDLPLTPQYRDSAVKIREAAAPSARNGVPWRSPHDY